APGGGVPGGTAPAPGGTGFPGGTRGGPGGPGGGPGGAVTVDQELVTLLQQDAGAYRWVAATTSASNAAPYQLAAGEAVLAVGGFNGTDRSTTLAAFQQLVAAGEVHYWIGGGGFGGARVDGVASQIATWVAENFEARTVGGTTVYDLTTATAAG
ncbi:MAG TPA: glycosyl transferase, partial [Mycobacteriales bacterium]|nr:glycosyl transferase [Mycobacteriales bacterium]